MHLTKHRSLAVDVYTVRYFDRLICHRRANTSPCSPFPFVAPSIGNEFRGVFVLTASFLPLFLHCFV